MHIFQMASLTLVSRQFLAHGRWPKANRLPGLSLAKAAFIHVVNYFAIFRAEAVVFFIQSQFVVKPDLKNFCLCNSNNYSLAL